MYQNARYLAYLITVNTAWADTPYYSYKGMLMPRLLWCMIWMLICTYNSFSNM